MGVIRRGNRLCVRLKGPDGKWGTYATEFVVGQEDKANRALEKLKRAVSAGEEIFGGKSGPVTVREYAERKLFPRRRTEVQDWRSDETRLRAHVFPVRIGEKVFGDLLLADVRTRHLVDVFTALRAKATKTGKPYAPKSIYNAYGVVKALFRDAIVDELIFASPCFLDERHLGPLVDADPEWRPTAKYSRDEIESLVSGHRVPIDRQVFYALEGLAALRLGEAAGLRWRHYDPTVQPLGRIVVAVSYDNPRTKTKSPRQMPVHPVLASILAEWKMSGWPSMMGRQPTPDDLIAPMPAPKFGRGYRRPLGSMRTKSVVNEAFKEDLAALGMRHRRGHDLRRAFITLARTDGANKDMLELCTHNPSKRRSVDVYTSFPWEVFCAEVSKLKVKRSGNSRGELIQLSRAVGETPTKEGPMPSRHMPVAAFEIAPKLLGDLDARAGNRTRIAQEFDVSENQSSANDVTESPTSEGVLAETPVSSAVEAASDCDGVTEAVNRAQRDWLSSGSTRTLRRNLLSILSMLETEGDA
jgi:integrase